MTPEGQTAKENIDIYVLTLSKLASFWSVVFSSFLSRKWKDNPQSRKKYLQVISGECLVSREFHGGPVLGLGAFTAEDLGSIPGQGTKIPQAIRKAKKQKVFVSKIHTELL